MNERVRYPHLEYFLLSGEAAVLEISKTERSFCCSLTGMWSTSKKNPVNVRQQKSDSSINRLLFLLNQELWKLDIYPPKADPATFSQDLAVLPDNINKQWQARLEELPRGAKIKSFLADKELEIWFAGLSAPHFDMQGGFTYNTDCSTKSPWEAIDRSLK